MKVWFTDFWHEETIDAIEQNKLYQWLKKWLDVTLDPDQPDWLIHSCFGYRHLCYPNTPKLCFLGENRRPDFKQSDCVIGFDHINRENYLRLPLYRLYDHFPQLLKPRASLQTILQEKAKDKFCAFIVSNNKAKERIDFFNKLNQYKHVDSGGRYLNNVGGPVPDKLAFLSPYKFSIAFENSSYPGYTTEKIMESLITNTIPIYWGDPSVAEAFNPKSFINVQDYESFDEAIEAIIEIDQDDTKYHKMLQEPFFKNGKEPAYLKEDFLKKHICTWLQNPPKQSITQKNRATYYTEYLKNMIKKPIKQKYLVTNLFNIKNKKRYFKETIT